MERNKSPRSGAETARALVDQLLALRERISDDALANPVRELAARLSRQAEAGEDWDLEQIEKLVDNLDKEAFARRAQHTARYVEHTLQGDEADPFGAVVEALSKDLVTFDEFSRFWSHTAETLVFTGHPTFLLNWEARRLLAELSLQGADPIAGAGLPDNAITLSNEHEQAIEALGHASDASHALNLRIIAVARERFPDDWRRLMPMPIGLATWVGYDMDGRTDIGWEQVIRHRLHEKILRLERYLAALKPLGTRVLRITTQLEQELTRCRGHLRAFSADLADPEKFRAAADGLTEDTAKLVSLARIKAELDEVIAQSPDDVAVTLLAVRADMCRFGLGMGEIHFRVNAAQVRNAARVVLGPRTDDDLDGQFVRREMSKAIEAVVPLRVNFATLAAERGTAPRLFMAMQQIRKHIDADSPIRLLIAECEHPVTVLAGIYLARRFGVDDMVDVCPLFETSPSLDRGGRILSVLLRDEAYKTYAKGRGRVCIETGFSDAGRFLGQIPAGLAVERLHRDLAKQMVAKDLSALDAVIFDTHGDSMGRGAHPSSMIDRCLYAYSPWARKGFAERNIRVRHEMSFQGGDGYIWFTTERLARRTLSCILAAQRVAQEESATPDPFYNQTAASLDFFNSVKRRQEDLFADPSYNIALGALGLALLPPTGSRRAKRQFDRQADEETSLRRIRAIPHNAILQQMGFLANILGGVGSAIAVEKDAFVGLAKRSARFRRLMDMVMRARAGSDMKTLIAYMNLYSGSFWATRPISGAEAGVEDACSTLAAALSDDGRFFAGLQLAARLRSDSIALTRSLTEMGFEASATSGHTDPSLDLLHIVRLVLLQRLFLAAAGLPAVTPAGNFSRDEVLEAMFSLDLERVGALLREAAPARKDSRLPVLAEPADPRSADGGPGPDDLDRLASDLPRIGRLLHRVTVGIANHFAALG